MIFIFLALSFSSDHSKYRKCSHSRFCNRNRNIESQQWSINSNSIKSDQSQFEATINDNKYKTNLKLIVNFLSCESIRIRVQPINKENFYRYDISKEPSVINPEESSRFKQFTLKKGKDSEILIGSNNQTIEIFNNPFKILINDKENTKIILNPDDSAVFETNRPKDQYPELFEQISFDYQTDSIPNGPTSVAMTVDFVSPSVRLSGLPSHSLPLTLPETDQSENVIRLFNTDPIKFDFKSTMSFHGSVPFIMSHSRKGCEGLFWSNPSETWVDTKTISKTGKESIQRARFISEGGYIDLFLFLGSNGKEITNKFTKLTGRPQLPPLFSFGFHQSRWGYYNKFNLLDVSKNYDENIIPHDSLWTDIEFQASNREIFTFNNESIPNPTKFFNEITKAGRYVIVPISPGIKATDENYRIYKEANEGGHFIMTKFNKSYFANSYSGKSAWPDFLSEKTRLWWETLFKYTSFKHSTPRMFVWNDLNAPTIFEDYELTLPRTVIHDKKYENREVHNVYGHLNTLSTYKGLLNRDKNARPFVLSNSFFAGTQKYAVITVAGSSGEWASLLMSVQSVLQLGLAGQVYAGIDVGGSYGKPNQKLLSRWYQVGAWIYPFFRSHCHHLASRREVYTLKNNMSLFEAARDAIVDRYMLLPYWYTLSRNANLTGEPIVRPIWYEFDSSDDEEFNYYADVDNIAMIGKSLLVAPFLNENEDSITVRLPSKNRWYCYKSLKIVKESKENNREVVLKYNSGRTAVFVRGGSIIPKKMQIRRSSELMLNDPYSLLVAVDENDKASGQIYIDDGKSFDFVNKNFVNKLIEFNRNKLTVKNVNSATSNNSFASNFKAKIDRIVITGLSKTPSKILCNKAEVEFNIDNNVVTINRLDAMVSNDFEIDFEY